MPGNPYLPAVATRRPHPPPRPATASSRPSRTSPKGHWGVPAVISVGDPAPRALAGAPRPGPHPGLPPRAGVGLKPQHVPDILDGQPDLGFFEVHAENYLVAGGPMHTDLTRIAARYPLSIHGVGLSIGGEDPLDPGHLRALRALLDRYQPALFSEHLAWSSHGGVFWNDLLPVPYDQATLNRVCIHLDQVQDALGRRILLENPATYVEFAGSTLSEAEFMSAILARTGCGLLLDVNNAYVSCTNHGRDCLAYLAALPLDQVGEVHLAGFHRDTDSVGDPLLIDSHGSAVDPAVWAL
ncbi:MAG: DUF692 domain-containing protein, partial [Chromatiaceae bacterium]|nr:DUF692 domain-containing protein [Chromatiaceae bacterium]